MSGLKSVVGDDDVVRAVGLAAQIRGVEQFNGLGHAQGRGGRSHKAGVRGVADLEGGGDATAAGRTLHPHHPSRTQGVRDLPGHHIRLGETADLIGEGPGLARPKGEAVGLGHKLALIADLEPIKMEIIVGGQNVVGGGESQGVDPGDQRAAVHLGGEGVGRAPVPHGVVQKHPVVETKAGVMIIPLHPRDDAGGDCGGEGFCGRVGRVVV